MSSPVAQSPTAVLRGCRGVGRSDELSFHRNCGSLWGTMLLVAFRTMLYRLDRAAADRTGGHRGRGFGRAVYRLARPRSRASTPAQGHRRRRMGRLRSLCDRVGFGGRDRHRAVLGLSTLLSRRYGRSTGCAIRGPGRPRRRGTIGPATGLPVRCSRAAGGSAIVGQSPRVRNLK